MEKALLCVSFGTSVPEAEESIAAVENALRAAAPDRLLVRAYTSSMICRKLAGRLKGYRRVVVCVTTRKPGRWWTTFFEQWQPEVPAATVFFTPAADVNRLPEAIRRADAVVALPGGCGTLEELLEIITWKQLGLFHRPIVMLNVDGFFNPLLDMLGRCVDEHFMKISHGCLWHVANDASDVLPLFASVDVYADDMVESKY